MLSKIVILNKMALCLICLVLEYVLEPVSELQSLIAWTFSCKRQEDTSCSWQKLSYQAQQSETQSEWNTWILGCHEFKQMNKRRKKIVAGRTHAKDSLAAARALGLHAWGKAHFIDKQLYSKNFQKSIWFRRTTSNSWTFVWIVGHDLVNWVSQSTCFIFRRHLLSYLHCSFFISVNSAYMDLA